MSVSKPHTRGNAIHQTILSEGFVDSAWEFSGMQDITNDSIDIHDMTGHSVVKNYSSATISQTSFISLQDISYTSYDKFGNVEAENISTYTD